MGISSGSLYPDRDRVAKAFALAAAAGLDGVEIICDPQPETHDLYYIRGLVERHGVGSTHNVVG